MSNYGKLQKENGRNVLVYERTFSAEPSELFDIVVNPVIFKQWYPFATGEMELYVGGKIKFDDGEGTTYEGVITELEKPTTFSFQEYEDLIEIKISNNEKTVLTFKHIFDDASMVVSMATGWHRCLDVLGKLINEEPVVWEDNAEALNVYYRKILS